MHASTTPTSAAEPKSQKVSSSGVAWSTIPTASWRVAASQTRLGEGDTPTGGYEVLNVGAGMRLVHRGIVDNLSIHCDNVLNRVYRDHLSVSKDFIPQPARGIRLNYEMTY